jgi:hypothetical protein
VYQIYGNFRNYSWPWPALGVSFAQTLAIFTASHPSVGAIGAIFSLHQKGGGAHFHVVIISQQIIGPAIC